MDFVYFLGRFHVLVLHIPIGLVVAILVLEVMARSEKYRHLEAGAPFLWAAAAISAVVTVALGYMHYAEGGFDGGSGNLHRISGTSIAVLLCIVAFVRCSPLARNYTPVYLPAAVLMVVLASMVGHYGGNLTHGSTFLVEYAPQPIRALAGLGPRRPPVTNLAAADPYLDVVGPMLGQRCGSCHNPDKRQGELDLSNFDAMMRGGETGSVVVSGRPQVSEMIRRITLPEDDEAFMPAEGNTPLTAAQIQIVEWWISAGIPVDTTIGQLPDGLPGPIEAALRTELDL